MAEGIKDNKLFNELSSIIEEGKKSVVAHVNRTLTIVYWQVGYKINEYLLEGERAEYGKNIIETVSRDLETQYGRGFAERNVRRMIQFSELFPDLGIVSPLATKLSWSHFVELLPIKNTEARLFYAHKSAEEKWSKRQLRKQIERNVAFPKNRTV